MQSHRGLQPEFRLLVFLVSIGFFMQGLDTTIINTALPAMANSLDENPLRMHSIVISYVLSVAAFIPLSGWLADRFGIRHVYLAAIVIFTLASLGCGLSQSYNQLIVFRVIQGLGGALLMPVGRLALLRLIPRDQFLSAMSLMSLAGLIGPLIGPSLGGWLVEYTTWHWIFLINIPMGILGVYVCLKVLPKHHKSQAQSFDFSGFVLLAITMIGLALGIETLSTPEQSRHMSGILLGSGLCAMLAYAYHAHTHQNALFRSQLFKNKVYSIGVLGNFFARLSGNAVPFLMPLMLQVAFDMEPLMTGLMLTPIVLGSLFSKPLVRPIIQKLGYRHFLVINTLLLGACIVSFALIEADTTKFWLGLHFFVFGTLNSLQYVSMNTLTLKDLAQQNSSSGNSFLSMIMMLSMSIGVALAGTLLNFFSSDHAQQQLSQAFHWSFLCLGLLTIITSLIFWQIPRDEAQ